MGKPHPIELRERVVAFVEQGHTHRYAAEHSCVSPRFVNNMVILKHDTGSLPPYSPDLNPIELAFSKLKSLLRRQREHMMRSPRLSDKSVSSIR